MNNSWIRKLLLTSLLALGLTACGGGGGSSSTTSKPDLSVTINSITQASGSATIDYTVSNSGSAAAGAFNVDFVADSATAPTGPTVYGDSVPQSDLAAGATVSGSKSINTSTTAGTAYAVVDPENAVAEESEDNNVSTGVPWTVPYYTAQTFDFESGTKPGHFHDSGDASWVVSTSSNPTGSNYSFQAGAITNSQTSCFDVSVGNVATLHFDYKLDSQSGSDALTLYRDGSFYWSSIGQVAWTTSDITIGDTAVHNYKWCNQQGTSGIAGLDSAWVDNIQFVAP